MKQTTAKTKNGFNNFMDNFINRISRILYSQKYARFTDFIYKRLFYLYIFLAPTILMFIVYACFGIHPFGEKSVLVLDLNGQYVSYYQAMWDWFHGDGSLIYDWSRNLSGEMFGVYAYYLASPFMFIICLMPRSAICGAVMAMQLFKIGSAAVTFTYLLRKISPKAGKLKLLAFSMMYSLMSFMVVQLMDPMWLDGLILLPLIVWGLHSLVTNGKTSLFIISLGFMFISHFYIGYMVGIFSVIFFVCSLFVSRKKPLKDCIIKFVASGIISLLSACFVLIPVYNSLKLGKFEFSKPDYSLETQFDFLSFLTKLFPMSYDTVRPEGLPMVYCGLFALMLVPLYFLNKKINKKQKIGFAFLCGVLFLSMYIRPVDMVWHGFQMPNWLPFRYSFILSFLLLVMAFIALENIDGVELSKVKITTAVIFAYLMWCEYQEFDYFVPYVTEADKDNVKHSQIGGIWLSMILAIIYCVLIHVLKKQSGKNYKAKAIWKIPDFVVKQMGSIVLCIVIAVELAVNAFSCLQQNDKQLSYSTYESMQPYSQSLKTAVDMIKDYDNSKFYRMEAGFHRTVCDPISAGYKGISHSSSTMNAPALTLLYNLGFAFGGNYTKYEGETLITDAIFDIKYVLEQQSKQYKYNKNVRPTNVGKYELAGSINGDDISYKFYKNPYAMGLGVVADGRITQDVISDVDPFYNQNLIFGGLSGEKVAFFNHLEPQSTEYENCATVKTVDGYTKYYAEDENNLESYVDYIVKMNRTSDLYFYLPTLYKRQCSILIQPEIEYQKGNEPMQIVGAYFAPTDDYYSILNLGEFERDEVVRIRVKLEDEEKAAYWLEPLFYSFDKASFERADEVLKHNNWNITEFKDTYVEGTVKSNNDGQVLFTTIPYEDGWHIKVDGEKVKPLKAYDSMICVPLEKGEHTVSMRFLPTYYVVGIILSVVGFLLMIFIFLLEFKNGKVIAIMAVKFSEIKNKIKDKNKQTEDEEFFQKYPMGKKLSEPTPDGEVYISDNMVSKVSVGSSGLLNFADSPINKDKQEEPKTIDIPLEDKKQEKPKTIDIPLEDKKQEKPKSIDIPLEDKKQEKPKTIDIPLEDKKQEKPKSIDIPLEGKKQEQEKNATLNSTLKIVDIPIKTEQEEQVNLKPPEFDGAVDGGEKWLEGGMSEPTVNDIVERKNTNNRRKKRKRK